MKQPTRQASEDLQAVQEVLRVVVISLGAMNPQAMPTVARALRAATSLQTLSPAARAMLADLALGLEMVTGQPPDQAPN